MKRVAVIGGGVAGMQTALRLAEQGVEPVIIEKEAELGGKLRGWHVLFPSFTPASEILTELRRRIGYIPQQGRLFSGTVKSNLKFAGDMVSDDDMHQAARIAQAEDFIAEREGGYDSPISQGGSNVSGGQRQRLAIARALAKKPEVVVFDDSFSALDYKTDARLREELAKNVTDAALVVVAQRIATIMHADQIIVLDDGHVVGTGTHEELLRSCPAYLEIAQSQLSAEELGLTQEEIAAVTEGGEH